MLQKILDRIKILIITEHPSIIEIKQHSEGNNFQFHHTTREDVLKILKTLNPKKATGCDQIPAKLLKHASFQIGPVISNIINKALDEGTFPNILKKAEVIPVYKKSDKLNKSNYRPVSILPILAKVFEKVLAHQITPFLNIVFSCHLSAFRQGYGCQDTLLTLIENWRKDLLKNNKIGALLMDLSKAFDCMPHELLIAKFKAYGVQDQSIKIIKSYLSDREQRVRIGNVQSSWKTTIKGVPQGSVLGPIFFNVFINDIFYFIKRARLTNYADDNTLSFAHPNFQIVKSCLEAEAAKAIWWFSINLMQANPEKFQLIFFNCKVDSPLILDGCIIKPEKVVKLLGITIDENLSFSIHTEEICKKAGRQLSALKRLSFYLDSKAKLALFRAFILSQFQYCSAVWYHCTAPNARCMEKIQERALKCVYFNHTASYESLLNQARLPSLEVGRQMNIAIQTFKILNDLSLTYLLELIEKRCRTRNLRNSKNILKIPLMKRVRHGTNSFCFSAPKIWNSLPEALRITRDLKTFRDGLRAYFSL